MIPLLLQQCSSVKFTSADPQTVAVCIQAIRHRRDCKICKMANIDRRADWVTHNDRNAPTNPAFWCEDCYRQMHYDAEGNACYQDYSAFSYMYEYGNLKQKQSADQSAAAESAPDETEGL